MNFFQRRKLKALRKKLEKAHAIRENNEKQENIKNEIAIQYQLANFYKKHLFDKNLPQADIYELECYRAIAALGEAKAQFLCGQILLNKAKFWDGWSKQPIYGTSIHKKYAQEFYEEAFAYLRAADEVDNVEAKRLLGMAYIYGWGQPKDINYGYKLILDSITLENAWDRATKIFEELKLSSPEFFTALQSYKRT